MLREIEEFLTDLKVEGRQPLTLEGHERHLKRISEWFEREGLDWTTATRREVQRYVRLWAERASSTRANLHTTLRTFYRWAVEEGYVAISPAAGLKTPKRPRPLPRSLTQEQVRRLIAYIQKLQGLKGERDKALILTGLYAGLRASELSKLRWSSVDMVGRVINIRLSKMNHGRAVPIHPELLKALEHWQELQGLTEDDGPVFTLKSEAIVAERAGKVCRQHSQTLRIPFTTHSLRHTFATMMLRASGNLYAVSKALGHLDIKQTEIYLTANVEDIRKALGKLPNMRDW